MFGRDGPQPSPLSGQAETIVVLNPWGGAFFGHSRAEVTRWIAAGGVSGYLVEELEPARWSVSVSCQPFKAY